MKCSCGDTVVKYLNAPDCIECQYRCQSWPIQLVYCCFRIFSFRKYPCPLSSSALRPQQPCR